MSKLEYQVGDLFENIPNDRNIIIAHVVNDEKVMGAGFVVPLMKRFPKLKQAYIDFIDKLEKGNFKVLGANYYHRESDDSNICVANMIAQHGTNLISDDLPPIRYDSLSLCMRRVAQQAKSLNADIICPRFGSGLACGRWSIIEAMVKEFWIDEGINVKVFVLDEKELSQF